MKNKILEILDRNKKEVDWKRDGIIEFDFLKVAEEIATLFGVVRQSEQLKEKKVMPFEDWIRVKGIKLLIDSNYRWDETYVHKDVVLKMYDVYLINL